ncbi:MAG TPA: hypothetical protein VKY85_07560 [Candidatus Angelobacter sp.]|nr:hypothetical protein [Candidatus Angelobacter sp.]
MKKRILVRASLCVLSFLALSCLGRAQVQVAIAPVPKLQFLDVNGKPLAGGCVFTDAAGTTTPQATYTDSTGTSQNTNPVILDSGGRASIWLTSSAYKFIVSSSGGTNCATGTTQYTIDGITAPNLGSLNQVVSASANPATSGFIRMANGDLVNWRNIANAADIGFKQGGVAAAGTGNLADVLQYGTLSTGGLQAQRFLDFSSAPAQSGDLAGGNNVCLVAARNAAGNGDVCVVLVNASNITALGASAGVSLSGPASSSSTYSGTAFIDNGHTNAAQSGSFRCGSSGSAGICVTARSPDNTADVQLGIAASATKAIFGTIAGSDATVTAAVGKLEVDTGVLNSGTGFQHVRQSWSCTVTTGSFDGCNITLSWNASFADTSYTAVCSVDTPNIPVFAGFYGAPKNAGNILVSVFKLNDGGSHTSISGTLDCIGVHD